MKYDHTIMNNEIKRMYWHSLTIRRMIRNSGYIGITRFTNMTLKNVTPPIVSEDVFNAANAQLDKPKVRTGRPKNEYLLRNHVFCAICGKTLAGIVLARSIAITSAVMLGLMRIVVRNA